MTNIPSLSLSLDFLSEAGVEITAQTPLSDCTTFRLGGPCDQLITCQTPQQVERVVGELGKRDIPFLLIGGGSNLLVSDEGVKGIVIRYTSAIPLVSRDGNDILVSGSTQLDDLVLFALENDLGGLNYASGIPGTVGGAVVGNAGAFGEQVGDYLKSVVLIDHKGNKKKVGPEALGFKYRDSHLKQTGDIVMNCRFSCCPADKKKMRQQRQEILDLRHQKHPDLTMHPCAGSFFRNIEPTSKAQQRQAAGWFLEQAGAKDFRVGGACVFEKHANIIIKSDGCTAQDVFDLSELMSTVVREKYNLSLIREVRLVGPFKGMENSGQAII